MKIIVVTTSILGGLVLPKTVTQFAITYLLFLMVFDFITGIWASYVERKEDLKVDKFKSDTKWVNNLLYICNNGFIYGLRHIFVNLTNTVKSEKLKLMGVKFLLYFSTIIVTYIFEDIFFIKKFNLYFSDLKFSLTLSVILFWSAVEWWSIFFENFKTIGIDIKGLLFKLIKNLLQIKTEITKLDK